MNARAVTALLRLFGRRHEADPAALLARRAERIVVAAGMMRSGSTWLFNAVRLLLEQTNERPYAFWISDYRQEAIDEGGILIAKIHSAHPALANAAWRIYTCHRDLRDVAVSLQDMDLAHGREGLLRSLAVARADYDFWSERADLIIPYEDIIGDAASVLTDLARSLEISVTPEALAHVAAELADLDGAWLDPAAPYDPVTIMHHKHRFDGRPGRYADSLDPATEDLILRVHGDWLADHGYVRRRSSVV